MRKFAMTIVPQPTPFFGKFDTKNTATTYFDKTPILNVAISQNVLSTTNDAI